MKSIITIGGSTSSGSINKQLAEYTGSLFSDFEVNQIDLNDFDMPVFSVDLENEQGFPESVKALNGIIEGADGFVISLAEHNGAYSAAFKNAFDWLSRIEGKVWRDKPMLILSTSPGPRGGQSVLDIAVARFPYNGGNIIGSMPFPSFYENFKEGEIVNDQLKSEIISLVDLMQKEI